MNGTWMTTYSAVADICRLIATVACFMRIFGALSSTFQGAGTMHIEGEVPAPLVHLT